MPRMADYNSLVLGGDKHFIYSKYNNGKKHENSNKQTTMKRELLGL